MKPEPTILVVDDEPVNITLLATFLEDGGYRILSAQTAGAALELVKAEDPDLILLDVMMPGVDGYQLCEQIKADAAGAEIPIIFVSARHETEDKIRGLEAGGVDYITKPFQREELMARVKAHLRSDSHYKDQIRTQADKLGQLSTAQKAMLVTPEKLPDARFAVYYKALDEAGADLYDVVNLGEEVYGYLVADISGHDLGASFATPAVKALFNQNAGRNRTPADTLRAINETLTGMMPCGNYVTACYVKVDRANRILWLAGAGHPAMLYQSGDGQARYVEAEGDVLGAFTEATFGEAELKLNPGDRLFLYSDGIIEAGERGRPEGLEKFKDITEQAAQLDMNDTVGHLHREMLPENEPLKDDILILGVEV